MAIDYWFELYQAWAKLPVPSRVNHRLADFFREQVAGLDGPVLLLGFTPSLSSIATDLIAVDRNIALSKHLWPGNRPGRRAIVADWLALPFAERSFDACVADGSLIALSYPEGVNSLLRNVASLLRPGGRFVCRIFASPESPEDPRKIFEDAMTRRIGSPQLLKFRIAMAAAALRGSPEVLTNDIADLFDATFPDRAVLAKATGWDRGEIDMIDLYRRADIRYSYPTRQQYRAVMPPGFTQIQIREDIDDFPVITAVKMTS